LHQPENNLLHPRYAPQVDLESRNAKALTGLAAAHSQSGESFEFDIREIEGMG